MKRISLPTHGLVELVAGIALVIAALALDLGTTGALLTFAGGVVLTGVGLGADGHSLGLHESLDRLLTIALAAGSIAAALAGSGLAAVVLLAAAATQLVLVSVTRWSRAPLAR